MQIHEIVLGIRVKFSAPRHKVTLTDNNREVTQRVEALANFINPNKMKSHKIMLKYKAKSYDHEI